MLVIRLRRIGKKNKPSYRIVVAEHSFPIDGRFVADLGFYNPHTKATGLKSEEAVEWMKKGAKPSNTIAKILEKEKVKHDSVVVEKKNKKPKAKTDPKAESITEPKAAVAPAAENSEAPAETPEAVEAAADQEVSAGEAVAEPSAPADETPSS
ncbi:MAG: 30S ribosomal protein S16 [Patescibacteria group bacterium]